MQHLCKGRLILFSPLMSLIVMYILKCLDIIQKLIVNQMEVCYLQILSGKDLYKQMIVVSARDGVAA